MTEAEDARLTWLRLVDDACARTVVDIESGSSVARRVMLPGAVSLRHRISAELADLERQHTITPS